MLFTKLRMGSCVLRFLLVLSFYLEWISHIVLGNGFALSVGLIF